MNIDKITYVKTFNIGNYESEKIGVDITLNEGDDAKFALSEAKKLVEEFHQDNIKKKEPILPPDEFTGTSVKVIEPAKKLDKTAAKDQAVIDEINACTSLVMLGTFATFVKGKKVLEEAYEAKAKTFKGESKILNTLNKVK